MAWLTYTFPIDIKIRQRPNCLCFTIMLVGDPTFPELKDNVVGIFFITLYDQYGNKGKFQVVPRHKNDGEKIRIYLVDA
ncbi:hypothetical protein WDV76_12980 [Xenorhabdus griffiniae]|uniref:hypothetical protein n=1 Tax=Xenorhabdus griffiniae TaxID=351672 RepID=UPI0030CE6AAB